MLEKMQDPGWSFPANTPNIWVFPGSNLSCPSPFFPPAQETPRLWARKLNYKPSHLPRKRSNKLSAHESCKMRWGWSLSPTYGLILWIFYAHQFASHLKKAKVVFINFTQPKQSPGWQEFIGPSSKLETFSASFPESCQETELEFPGCIHRKR